MESLSPRLPANIYMEWVRKMDAWVHLWVIFFTRLIIMLYHFPFYWNRLIRTPLLRGGAEANPQQGSLSEQRIVRLVSQVGVRAIPWVKAVPADLCMQECLSWCLARCVLECEELNCKNPQGRIAFSSYYQTLFKLLAWKWEKWVTIPPRIPSL